MYDILKNFVVRINLFLTFVRNFLIILDFYDKYNVVSTKNTQTKTYSFEHSIVSGIQIYQTNKYQEYILILYFLIDDRLLCSS